MFHENGSRAILAGRYPRGHLEEAGAGRSTGVQVTDLFSMLRRDWWPIILLPIIAVGITFSMRPAKTYTATDTVQVLPAGGTASINAGTVSQLLPGIVGAMSSSGFAAGAATAAHLPVSVADAPVKIAVGASGTTPIVTITATSAYEAPVAPWANAYGNYLINHKNVVDPQGLTTISQVSTAVPAVKSSSTKTELIGAGLAGVVIGLLVALGIGFYRADKADPEKIRRRYGTDVVVEMPFVRARSRLRAPGAVLNHSRTVHELNLRLKLSGITGRGGDEALEAPSRVIAVLSEVRGEGRTEVTNALAWEMARSGQSVAVVHADLQPLRRSVPRGRPELGAPGIKEPVHVDLAEDQLEHAEVVLTTLPQIIRDLAATHDVVLVDGPPMSAGADAQVVAVLAGAVLWVSARHVDRNQLRRRLTEMEQHGVELLGLVVNKPLRRWSPSQLWYDGRVVPQDDEDDEDDGTDTDDAHRAAAKMSHPPAAPAGAGSTSNRVGPEQLRPSAVAKAKSVPPPTQAPPGTRASSPAKPIRRPDGGLSWG